MLVFPIPYPHPHPHWWVDRIIKVMTKNPHLGKKRYATLPQFISLLELCNQEQGVAKGGWGCVWWWRKVGDGGEDAKELYGWPAPGIHCLTAPSSENSV